MFACARSDKLDVEDHYVAWRQVQEGAHKRYANNDGPFSFCTFPFLLTPKAKSKLLHTETRYKMTSVSAGRVEGPH
jgi:hypothetical protein